MKFRSVIVILFSLLVANSVASAQIDSNYYSHVRTTYLDELGVAQGRGLSYSPSADAFLFLEDEPKLPAGSTETNIRFVPYFDGLSGSLAVPGGVDDPVNLVFDDLWNRLLMVGSNGSELIEVSVGEDGRPLPNTFVFYNLGRLGVKDPQGMTVDPLGGHLFILEGAGPSLVRIDLKEQRDLRNNAYNRYGLSGSGLANVRGLAFDPTNGHLHTFDPKGQTLVEMTTIGRSTVARDLSPLEIDDLQGLVFAPSLDRTDDPAQFNLYIVNGGTGFEASFGDQRSLPGQLIEISFVEPVLDPAAASLSSFTSTLLQAIETFNWNPPSPDSSGITYLPSSNRLLVSDSEVNEMPIFTGDNLFEAALNGNLTDTLTTISFSDEPTGVTYNPTNDHLFFSDDTGTRSVYELDPGPDGNYDTADDVVTSFKTGDFGSHDPEGIAYDSSQGFLYLVDGVNNEVYEIDPGANGIFDGVPPAGDDKVSGFDTSNKGVNDPEGIAINSDTGNLYVVGKPPSDVLEVTTNGNVVQIIDISAAKATKPAGLAYAPSSTNPQLKSLWIAARGVDNNSDPNENDGYVYEMSLPGIANAPPVANDDSANTPRDTTVTIDVAANDSDPNGDLDPSSANTDCNPTCSNPGNGTLVSNGDGTFDYTPNTGFSGNDSFVYEICDLQPACDTATVNITVTAPNDPPVANNDNASTDEDTTVNIDVAINDLDPEGSLDLTSTNTTCIGCSDTANGILVNNGDGTFDYTPGQDFNGADSFIYEICDVLGLCDTATVSITISPVDDPPVANDDEESTFADTGITVLVTDNDTDPEGNLDPGTAVDLTAPANGSVVNNGNGSFTYTPDPGFGGPDSFDYQVCDTTGLCDSATVTITVLGDQIIYVTFSTSVSVGGISAADEDILAHDPAVGTWSLYFDGSDVGLGGGGLELDAIHINPDGSILLSTDRSATIAGFGDIAEQDIVRFIPTSTGDNTAGSFEMVFDGSDVGMTASTHDIDAFGYAPDGNLLMSTRGSYSFGNISGGDEDLLKFVVSSLGPDTSGSWELYLDGADPGVGLDTKAEDINGLWVNTNGELYLTVRGAFDVPGLTGDVEDVFICDPISTGDNSSCNFSHFWHSPLTGEIINGLAITGAQGQSNYPPVANDDSASTPEDTPVTIDVAANDVDVDGNLDPATANTACANGSTGCTGPTNGGLLNNGDGTFDYTPDPAFAGNDNFVYEICDTGGLCDTATAAITVSPVNDPPVAVDDNATTDEDTVVTIDVAANDSDPEGALDPASANTSCATCADPANGTLTNNADGTFGYTPNTNFNGSDSFVYEICDTGGMCDTATVNIAVNPVNDPPVATDDSAVTPEDTLVPIDVAANDTDVDGNLDPTSTNTSCATCADPANGTLVNNGDGTFNYTPSPGFIGSDSFVYEICDSVGPCDTASVNITVTISNDPPVANDDSAVTPEDTPMAINVAANDTDLDGNLDPTTTNTACGGCTTPANGSVVNNANGTFDYTPNADYNGPDSFVYEICDALGLCDTATVTITVNPVNDPPVAVDDDASTPEDTPVLVDVAANDADVDGNLDPTTVNTTCAGCSNPSSGNAGNNGDGTFNYTPIPGFNGADSFIYEICDTAAACATATVNITVSSVNDPPVAVDDDASTPEDTPVTIDVAANDTDPEGLLDPTTANTSCATCAEPTNGTLVNNGDGSFDYTPNLNFNGADSFVYEICDTGGLCDTATASISMSSVNDPPVAVDDSASTAEDTPVVIDVAANDTDPEGGLDLTTANTGCATCAGPANGTLVNNGDGTFDYTPNPGFTGSDSFVYQICDSGGLCDTATANITVSGGLQILYVSTTSGGTVDNINFYDEDILALDLSTGTWSMYFDGSDVGLVEGATTDLNAFHILADGSILLSLNEGTTLPDVGAVDAFDIVRFIPTSTGDTTAGTYEMYFDGEDVELGGEMIDALGFAPDGRLVISTGGSYRNVGGLSGGDVDLLAFTATSLGANTSGTWEMYMRGPDVGLTQDLNAAWIDSNGGIFLSVKDPFTVPGLSGDDSDIFTCVPGTPEPISSCTFSMFWEGSVYGLGAEDIDGMFIGP